MTAPRGWVIHRYDRVSSTMDVAARLARLGASERTAVVAAEQTAGRGRSGRPWQAPPGSALFCTFILRPSVAPQRLSTLPLAAGVAVAEALEDLTDTPVQLKWPNDVWIGSDLDRRKVAGILTASVLVSGAVDFALLGIGVNVLAEVSDLPPGATSLLAATGARIPIDDVLSAILSRFGPTYEAFLSSSTEPMLDLWRSRAVLVGESVTVEEEDHVRSGVFIGIDDDGALLLRDQHHGVQRIIAGELTRGPRVRSSTVPSP